MHYSSETYCTVNSITVLLAFKSHEINWKELLYNYLLGEQSLCTSINRKDEKERDILNSSN